MGIMYNQSHLIIGAFKEMRKGVLFMIIGWLLIAGGIVSYISALMALISSGIIGRGHIIMYVPASVSLLVGLIITIIIGALILLMGLYMYFIPGTRKLSEINSEYVTPAKLIRLGYVWGLLLLIVGLILTLILTAVYVGAILAIVGLILVFIGYVGIIVLAFKLRDVENNNLYLVAGLLFIVGIVIPGIGTLLWLLAWILMYVALGDSIRRHEKVSTS